MSTLLWFILIAAFMFFMHRGRGARGGIGCCGGGGHSHGSHGHNAYNGEQQNGNTEPDFNAMQEAEYELIEEQPEKQIYEANDTDHMHHSVSESHIHIDR